METTTPGDLERQFRAAVAALDAVSRSAEHFRAVDDAVLVELGRLAARQKQLAEANLATVAGEIAARSVRSLGHDGLAQREGFRSAEELVKATTGSSGREAGTAVRVGRMVRDATVDDLGGGAGEAGVSGEAGVGEPWLGAVAVAVSAGRLSVGAADAIRTGLGTPSAGVDGGADGGGIDAAALAEAADRLVEEAQTLDVDRLLRRARELRDELDEAGIADRERERFERRSLRHYRLPDGMGRVVWQLEPESYAVFTELYDRATSPKRGVRFVSGSLKETADRILDDPRSIEQLASDTLLGLLQAGADADSSRLLATGAAAIRVLVSAPALRDGVGHGRIEGSPEPVSIGTVARLACGGATTPVTIDGLGQPLDVGREQRFFTRKQRIALAVRDGGCRFGHCDRPPSMCESHHIRFWARDGGQTNIADGVLLCKFHHLLIHNNGWEIERIGADYFLVPPADVDPARTPRAMPGKSAAMRDLRRELTGAGV